MKVINGIEVTDELAQKAEWRARTIAAILASDYDLETKEEMLNAALAQAREEGILDSASICKEVGANTANPQAKFVCGVLSNSLRELADRDRKTRISVVNK